MKFQATFSNHDEFSLKNMPRYHLVRPFRLSKWHFISHSAGAVLVNISQFISYSAGAVLVNISQFISHSTGAVLVNISQESNFEA